MVTSAATTVEQAGLAELRLTDVGGISEITILPDGRLYVLGLSEAVLALLDAAGPWSGLSPDRRPRHAAERAPTTRESTT